MCINWEQNNCVLTGSFQAAVYDIEKEAWSHEKDSTLHKSVYTGLCCVKVP